MEECLKIEDIQRIVGESGAESVLTRLDKCFEVYPALKLNERVTGLYRNGVKLRAEQAGAENEDVYRVYGADGGFLGLGRMTDGGFRSVKNFFV